MSDPKINPPALPVSPTSGGAERSAGSTRTEEIIVPGSHEVNLPPDVKEAGVESIPNEGTVIELPPDVKKMGVTPSGPTAPVGTSSSSATVQFPVADDQLIKDSNGPVTAALTWLAIWCIKKLKKMHLAIRTLHGKTVRVHD